MSATAERWIVRCPDYTVPTVYKTQADAERAAERIALAGQCRLPHEVVRS